MSEVKQDSAQTCALLEAIGRGAVLEKLDSARPIRLASTLGEIGEFFALEAGPGQGPSCSADRSFESPGAALCGSNGSVA
jgi:hypothetical protein